MGRHHVRILAGMASCELVGLADPNAEKEALAGQYGAAYFADYRALLDTRPDLVSIAAPTALHYRIACDALDAGCHLLIEKPICASVEDAEQLMAKAEAAGRSIAIGHVERFNPAVRQLKEIVASGELGEILTVNNLRVGPYHGRILDTGIVLDLGTHDVDLISYLLGERAESVFATAIRRVHSHEDHAVLQLAFSGGKSGIIETSWLAPYRARNIFLVGTKHFALCDLQHKVILVYDDNPRGGSLLSGIREVPQGDALEAELADVVECITNGHQPLSTAPDSIYALKVCLAALESIASGASVPVAG
jgi:UDP-N-acetylglucosamine 3-dehydrogenase